MTVLRFKDALITRPSRRTVSKPGCSNLRRQLSRILWAMAILLGACQASNNISPTNNQPETNLQITSPPSATPVVVQMQPPAIHTVPPFPVTPSPVLDPLEFTFPTNNLEASSLWRPPLYPVPWEPTPHDHFYFSRPIGANEINWPLPNYRYGGVFFLNDVHTGIDIPAPKGTPVLAAGPGEVIWAGWGLYLQREDYDDPYGMAVAIKHDFGYEDQSLYTIYGHMDEMKAWRGQRVKTGDLLGYVGETGNVTGPHLHFEVRIGDNNYSRSRNPELWIAPPQGWGVLAARVVGINGSPLKKVTVNLRNIETNRNWYVITYGEGSTNSDTYYQENMVIGDLPAGLYDVWVPYEGRIYDQKITIHPGMVSYFLFQGGRGFFVGPPPTPSGGFQTPVIPSPTPTITATLAITPTTNP